MKLSVVISVFNEEGMIAACLHSLSRQSRVPDEIILVDNNCTDRTLERAKKFNVTIIKEAKQGIWAARSTGYDAATGDIIICTDADARFPREWLERIEDSFNDSGTVAVSGPGRFYDGGRIMNKLADICYVEAFFILVGAALANRPLFGSNFAMRKSAWLQVRDKVHSHTEEVFDDIDITYHLLPLGGIRFVRRLYNYISIRPVCSPMGMFMRYRKGLRSVTIHWPEQAPHGLYRKKLLSR